MNIEAALSASSANKTTTSLATNSITINKNGNSFKEEMSIKQKDSSDNETKVEAETEKTTETNNKQSDTKVEQKNSDISEQSEQKEKVSEEKTETNIGQSSDQKNNNTELYESLNELNSKIESMNELKSIKMGQISTSVEKNQYLNTDLTAKSDLCKTINFDKADATFFLNLVNNQSMTAQSSNNLQQFNQILNFTEIKTEAAQKSLAVSQTLINCLNESMKTNKPFRIDFDNDIAVIMKVDSNGKISANFIPGSSAVENYLRNNIGYLRQNFEEQNLKYSELTYTSQNQQNRRQKQSKEQEDKES